MKLIVGLGNPGKEYENTPHNVGFDTVDKLASMYGGEFKKTKKNAKFTEVMIGQEKTMLIKPQTYMNSSGESVWAIVKLYKIKPQDIIVVLDDIDVAPGVVRLREMGSAGTHNGLRNIVSRLGYTNFARVRIGVGKPINNQDLADYVLSKIPEDKQKQINEGIDKACQLVVDYIQGEVVSTTV